MDEIDYKISGLSLQRSALMDALRRVPKHDTFASMLIMGKIKAVQRELDESQGLGKGKPRT